MKKFLFVAEKPSLMLEVRNCYNNHKAELNKKVGLIDFIALAGHVCAYGEPNDYEGWDGKWEDIDYPMIPKNWIIKPIPRSIETLNKIKKNVNSYDGIIVGTDSDTEGYGIYHLVEQYLHIEDKFALRFVEHSLTDKEILEQLLIMTDFHKDPVHVRFTQAYTLRSRMDWLYGMNCSRTVSIRVGSLMTVGRVKAVTLKLVYDNSMAIANFRPEKYYTIEADYGDFKAVMVDEKGMPVRINDLREAKGISLPLEGVVANKKTETAQTRAPKLYDLASLQVDAGRMLNFAPSETLQIAQSLYEKHKVLSYPRTQCRFVSTERAKEFPSMLQKLRVFDGLAPVVDGITPDVIASVCKDRQIVNDAEVQKESHDALLPTSKVPVLSEMTDKEIALCKLIYIRLLAQFMPKLTEEKTALLLQHGDKTFLTRGKVVRELGWRGLYGTLKDATLPLLEKGEPVTAKKIQPSEKVTKPKARLTQGTLIEAMKNVANLIENKTLRESLANSQGIGTPATRAAIIADLIKRGYMHDKKGLYITEQGKLYIESLKGFDIISPEFAAIMDYDIKKVQRGETDYDTAYKKILDGLNQICRQIGTIQGGAVASKYLCQKCGDPLYDKGYYYACKNDDYKLYKKVGGRTLTEKNLDDLHAGKILPPYTYKSKEGKSFKARLKLTEDGIAYDFSSGLKCPFCGADMRLNRGGAFCDCGLKVFRNISDKELTDAEIKTLVTKKQTPVLSGFKSKEGEEYSASLYLTNDKKVYRKYQ